MTWEYCRNNPKPFNGMKHSYSFTKPLNSLNRDASAGVPTFDCCVQNRSRIVGDEAADRAGEERGEADAHCLDLGDPLDLGVGDRVLD